MDKFSKTINIYVDLQVDFHLGKSNWGLLVRMDKWVQILKLYPEEGTVTNVRITLR